MYVLLVNEKMSVLRYSSTDSRERDEYQNFTD